MKFFLVLFICLRLYAHGDHSHDHGLSHKHLNGIYQTLDQELHQSIHPPLFKIDIAGESYKFTDSYLAQSLRLGIEQYLEEIQSQCNCSTEHLKEDLEKKLPHLKTRLANKLKGVGHFIEDVFWTEVAGVRRYGIIYLTMTIVGEIIDHTISPVPLCKLVQTMARVFGKKIKSSIHMAILNPSSELVFSDRIKGIISRREYRKSYQSKLQKHFKKTSLNGRPEKGIRRWLFQFSMEGRGVRDFTTPPQLYAGDGAQDIISLKFMSFEQRQWIIDRHIRALDYYLDFATEIAQGLYHDKKISLKQYLKFQLNSGRFGSFIDRYHSELILLSFSHHIDREALLNKILEFDLIKEGLWNFSNFIKAPSEAKLQTIKQHLKETEKSRVSKNNTCMKLIEAMF